MQVSSLCNDAFCIDATLCCIIKANGYDLMKLLEAKRITSKHLFDTTSATHLYHVHFAGQRYLCNISTVFSMRHQITLLQQTWASALTYCLAWANVGTDSPPPAEESGAQPMTAWLALRAPKEPCSKSRRNLSIV